MNHPESVLATLAGAMQFIIAHGSPRAAPGVPGRLAGIDAKRHLVGPSIAVEQEKEALGCR